ncbi:MAG: hypothetical protein Q7R95_02265 [bacterium]|nr:hypothetical protein [bacterium]
MENHTALIKNYQEFSIVLAAHIGISMHRIFRFLNHQLPTNYHTTTLYAEHILSHATRPLFFSSIMGLNLSQSSDVATSVILSASTGILYDGLIPLIQKGHPQLDQIAANFVGEGLFFIAASLLLQQGVR